MGYFSERRRIKREFVNMHTPWIDKIKDAGMRYFYFGAAILIIILAIRGHVNGAW
jgi:hypothetical protein